MTAAPAPGPRSAFGIYVHVPFCVHRCWYCDFNAYAGLEHLASEYMDALAADARQALSAAEPLPTRPPVTSVFFGGGTPSLVDASLLTRVLDEIRWSWPMAPDVEITVECNPESVDPGKLEAYLRSGVNRLSFGVQSLDDRLLTTLGRAHDVATALGGVRMALDAGFEDVNADLIFGVPGEDDAMWRSSLEGIIELGVQHVSCYGLTYEEGTPLDAWRRLGKVTPVPDDDVASRWEMACDMLGDAGFERYEISNWSLPGHECRHNLLYWGCGDYLGIGAGAHSHLNRVRSWTVKAPQRYAQDIVAGRRPVLGSEEISPRERMAEVMFLGLRRSAGVTVDDFSRLAGADLQTVYGAELHRLRELGLVAWDGMTARLTRRGTLLANEAVTAFLVDDEGHAG